tara:strand:- start:374 stop:601 length:228 start_codon:yes stop_codon:yes gene_type:complete
MHEEVLLDGQQRGLARLHGLDALEQHRHDRCLVGLLHGDVEVGGEMGGVRRGVRRGERRGEERRERGMREERWEE